MINFFSSALENNYILNKDKGIYHREGFFGISYSDGSAIENNILNIIKTANDVSIHSEELRSKCTTWETTYHFSPIRTNILRPFEKRIETSTVLEIGAGCGAITRYLGECGAQVHALEGSMKRAEIARERTRDLDNVHIICDNFEDYNTHFKYDIITLIGVLEYAPLFIKGESPVKAMLKRVRKLLKDDGVLILAIENQLGLKYFAGCPEDHKWRVMYGIEGRYGEGDAITFGRKRLASIISEAGYESIDFMAAFPDYKMPNTIITEFGFQCEQFNSTALVTENVTKDYQLADTLYLSQELAWSAIHDNDLSLDLANSFLIVASPNESLASINDINNTLAYHYSVNRAKHFSKKTVFLSSFPRDSKDSKVTINVSRIYESLPHKVSSNGLVNSIPNDNVEYFHGVSLSDTMRNIVAKDYWSVDDFIELLKQYILSLANKNNNNGLIKEYAPALLENFISGSYIDSTPQNIIITADGEFQYIDQEWSITENIPIKYLLFRALLLLIQSLSRFGFNELYLNATRKEFFISVYNLLGVKLDDSELKRLSEYEQRYQSKVAGLIIHHFEWYADKKIPMYQPCEELSLIRNHIKETEQELENSLYKLSELTEKCTIFDSERNISKTIIKEQQDFIDDLQRENANVIGQLNIIKCERDLAIDTVTLIHQSRAWKAIMPIRNFYEQVKQYERKVLESKYAVIVRYFFQRYINGVKKHGVLRSIPMSLHNLISLFDRKIKKINNIRKHDEKVSYLCDLIRNEKGFIDIFHVAMGWNTPLFQRFQHVSIQSARLGGLALYGGHRQVDTELFVYDEIENGLIVFDALDYDLRGEIFKALSDNTTAIKVIRIQSIDLATSIDEVKKYINSGFKVVYEYIDEISDEITGGIPEFALKRHHWMLESEDDIMVIATSNKIFDDVKKYRNKNCLLSTNGVDVNHWSKNNLGEIPKEISSLTNTNKVIVGYHGALAKWIDYDLLHRIADDELFEIVLIGHEHDSSLKESKLLERDNVHFIGSRSYFDLPVYAAYYDIGILPFKKYELTDSVSPVKLFEYMALGIPVVTTDLPECLKYESCLVSPADDYEQFVENLHIALLARKTNEYKDMLFSEANQNSWRGKTIEYLNLAGVKF